MVEKKSHLGTAFEPTPTVVWGPCFTFERIYQRLRGARVWGFRHFFNCPKSHRGDPAYRGILVSPVGVLPQGISQAVDCPRTFFHVGSNPGGCLFIYFQTVRAFLQRKSAARFAQVGARDRAHWLTAAHDRAQRRAIVHISVRDRAKWCIMAHVSAHWRA